MTVTDVILNFRAALVAVLPMVETLGIPWKRGDAYDEWDDLASCMYKQLVGSLFSEVRVPLSGAQVRLAAYDMMLPDYSQYATIDVQNMDLGPGRWVFHAFGTDTAPFDVLEVRELSIGALPCSEELRTCSILGSRFTLILLDGSSIEQVPVYCDPQ